MTPDHQKFFTHIQEFLEKDSATVMKAKNILSRIAAGEGTLISLMMSKQVLPEDVDKEALHLFVKQYSFLCPNENIAIEKRVSSLLLKSLNLFH